MHRSSSETSVAIQFALAGLVWGSSFLFIAVALTGVTPIQITWGRMVFGAVTLALLVAIRRERLPRGGIVWLHLFVVGVTFCILPYLLFAWAQQHVSSGLASILNATTAIMTAVMAWAVFRVERLTMGQIAGIVLGLCGVVVIIGPGTLATGGGDLLAPLALVGATACYGFSLAYQRRFLTGRSGSGLATAFGFIVSGAVVMLALTPWAIAPMRLDGWVIASVVLLGCLGTGLAYLWNQNTLRAWGPTRASTVTYITPVVGVTLGILVLDESLTWNEPVGAVVVFAGILLVQRRLRRPRAMPAGHDDGADAAASAPSSDTVSPAAERPEGRARS